VRTILRLILWDVDGTLVLAGPAAREAFDAAVRAVVGRDPGPHGVQMTGKTDPQIALEILATMAVSERDAAEHLPGIMRALETQLEAAVGALRRGGRALTGARALLARLGAEPSILQTVLSGNVEANARLKLRVFGLDRWMEFECGAYGSDHHDRNELVPIVLEKIERRHGVRVDPAKVWVIGDTPLDLACARAGGARCLLVGTGRIPLAELREAEPDALFPDLADTAAVIRLLTSED